MLLLLFRSQISPCIWNNTEKQIFRGAIYCPWLNDHSIFHPLSFLDLSYFMSLTLHFEQYYIIATRAYVLLYFPESLKKFSFLLLLAFLFYISCNAVLQIQFKRQPVFFCPRILSLLVFQEKKLALTLDLPGIVLWCFCETKQEVGEGNVRIRFSNGIIVRK